MPLRIAHGFTNSMNRGTYAWAGLLVMAITFAIVAVTPRTYLRPGPLRDGPYHDDIISRLRRGEDYYATISAELPARYYPTDSVFNWRPPALYLVLASAPPTAAQLILVVLALTAFFLGVDRLRRTEPIAGTCTGIIGMAGAAAFVFQRGAYVHAEIWSGLLIAISWGLYARSAPLSAALAAIAALFARELAAPYAATCAFLAARGRRSREVAIWLAASAAYGAYYLFHLKQVRSHSASVSFNALQWFHWNGVRFIMETIQQTNAWLTNAPHWLLAAALALLAAALWRSTMPRHLRDALIAYAAFFSVAGGPLNDYWGFIVSFSSGIAAGYGIGAIIDLWRGAIGTRLQRRRRRILGL